MLRLHVLNLGRMKMDANLVAQKTSIATLDDPVRPNFMSEFPVPAFLIESDSGYMLYDTGCHPEAMLPNGRWPEAFQKQCPWDGDETKTPMYILKQMGIQPNDIKTIILSHMHNDHAGCVEFFPKAHYIVAKDEFSASLRAYAQHAYMSSYIWKDTDVWTKLPIDWELLEPDEGDIQLMPGVTILNLGSGHAYGVLALKLDLENTGTVILSSDAIYCACNYNEIRLPGVVLDSIGWTKSCRRIKRIAEQTNAQVWFGHDMEQFKTLKTAPDFYYD